MRSACHMLFVIGENKTGTLSLHSAFERLGLRSLHFSPGDYETLGDAFEQAHAIREAIQGNIAAGRKARTGYDEYDVLLDIGPVRSRFDVFDADYPRSNFIYTDRDDADWVESRRKHVLRLRPESSDGLGR